MTDAIEFSLEPGEPPDATTAPVEEGRPEARDAEAPVQVGWKRELHERNILFVDDDDRFLKLCGKRFEASDYRIFTADGAESALELMKQQTIDIVISDMNMPGISGAELLHEIERKYPEAIRVIISGKFDLADTIAAINQGHIYKYLTKPFNDKDVKLTIYQALLEKERREAEERRRRERQENIKRRARQLGEMVLKTRYRADQAYEETLDVLTCLVGMANNNATRVADVAAQLAESMGESEAFSHQVRVAALLKDLALLGTSRKPTGQMSDAEKEEYIRHPIRSAKLVHEFKPWREAAFMIKSHHERFDGKGFPSGAIGEEIPLGARIIAIAECYVHERSRQSCHDDTVLALAAISERFDPALLTALASLEDEAPDPY
ncbi:MAG TPA: response regulator [Pseudomonadales bacterium]|nr:response regulator [Pseudomonadales bacterium]